MATSNANWNNKVLPELVSCTGEFGGTRFLDWEFSLRGW